MHNDKTLHAYLFILFGPTGVGKTDVALKFTQELPAEIVNIDVGQFYTRLSIGTAKPNWRVGPVPQHLFDIIHTPRNCTVIEYRERFLQAIREIQQRDHLPVVVGGSSFYVHSLFFPPHVSEERFIKGCQDCNDRQLWQKLYEVDPDRAKQIHPHDTYRIERALAIWYATGKKPSVFIPTYAPPSPYTLICLTRDRQELYSRINERTKAMIKAGWIDEVKNLVGTEWEPFLRVKNLIGYSELFDYLEGRRDLADTIALIQQETRNYAKRQLVFWRCLEKQLRSQSLSPYTRIETVNLTTTNIDLYIKQLSKQIMSVWL